jgi:ubiquinone/menaquinone biosynthesis C-methylase UbiE
MSSNKSRLFYDPAQHPEWVQPHTPRWYSQLATDTGGYKYPWKSNFDGITAEAILSDKILSCLMNESRVLDVGCGHGEFTYQFGTKARDVVGIDMNRGFIDVANVKSRDNIRFLTVNVEGRLPFPDHYFDVIYTKKGPQLFNKGNLEGSRIIKKGGTVIEFHHLGTDGGLRELFPRLYSPLPRNWNSMERVESELKITENTLSNLEIQIIEETEYLLRPEDVLIKKCFGQNAALKKDVWEKCLKEVEDVFHRNATDKGLEIMNSYSLVTGFAP